MSENLPAVPTPAPTREIATTDTDSWTTVVADVARLADHIAGTEFVPRQMRNSAPAVAAAILYGREVGLAPMTALTQTHVIEGKPSMSAEAMRALVFAAGHELHFEEATGATCIMRARRAGSQEWTRLAWTIDQARAAGLLGKDNWKKYPRAMLIARCTADICRMVFPDVIHGFRAEEEFDGELVDAVEEPAAPTTKVGRARKTAAKKAAAAEPPPLEQRARPERPAGPPLPGEDGYDGTPREGAASEQAGEVSEAAATPDPEESEKRSPRGITRPQQRMLMGQFTKFGLSDDAARDERIGILSKLAGREVSSSSDLTSAEATRVIDTLARVEGPEQLLAIANGNQS